MKSNRGVSILFCFANRRRWSLWQSVRDHLPDGLSSREAEGIDHASKRRSGTLEAHRLAEKIVILGNQDSVEIARSFQYRRVRELRRGVFLSCQDIYMPQAQADRDRARYVNVQV